jgi:hypothetical protein
MAAQGRLDLGELVLGAGEADLETLDLAGQPSRSASAMRSCRLARIAVLTTYARTSADRRQAIEEK